MPSTLDSGRGSSDLPGKQGQQACREPWGLQVTPAPVSFSIRSVMQKYLEDRGEVTFEKIFSQKLGEYGGDSAGPGASATCPAAQAGGWGQEDAGATFLPPPQPTGLCSPLPGGLASHHRGRGQGSQRAPPPRGSRAVT